MPAQVILSVSEGPLVGQTFTFREHDTFIFGRAPDCHAHLPPTDISASRHHFLLEVNPPDARLRDLGSLNGTFVNRICRGSRAPHETPEEGATRQAPQVELTDGDRISVGRTTFVVSIVVPDMCLNCGVEFSSSGLEHGDTPQMLCERCREMEDAQQRADAARHCQRCKKPASSEISKGRVGDYLCPNCLAEAGRNHDVVLALASEGAESYDLLGRLGDGGMGAVYLAKRRATGEQVALKVMLARIAVTESARRLFQREIDNLRHLSHPHIVRLLDHGSKGGVFYFAMDYCEGGTFEDLRRARGGRVPAAEAVPLMLQVLEGLSYAHAKGFVHRDLKPQNMLLTSTSQGIAKVSDFGLAKSFERAGLSGFTATGDVAGTLAFMAREQLINFRFVQPVSDVWSVAATLYAMLTGFLPRPFQRGQDEMEIILKGGTIPIRERGVDISDHLAEVIDTALSDDLNRRFGSAATFAAALADAMHTSPHVNRS